MSEKTASETLATTAAASRNAVAAATKPIFGRRAAVHRTLHFGNARGASAQEHGEVSDAHWLAYQGWASAWAPWQVAVLAAALVAMLGFRRGVVATLLGATAIGMVLASLGVPLT